MGGGLIDRIFSADGGMLMDAVHRLCDLPLRWRPRYEFALASAL
jgi:hypothetical protein